MPSKYMLSNKRYMHKFFYKKSVKLNLYIYVFFGSPSVLSLNTINKLYMTSETEAM